MGVRIDSHTKSWLLKHGAVITISPVLLPWTFRNKQVLFDFECEVKTPEDKENYYEIEKDGISIFIDKKIQTKVRRVDLWVRGRPPFEQLDIKGLKRFSTVDQA
ncbi:hypothetical protein [Alkalicoccus halolimnae]|uniref:Uncharacterized protein n=1 Tax=Alkalicoccus halolimnae TaxID=1667239 RepID=A0A5C7FHI6_9BACI|nr:hypothetical protein [Alkalicoccus halolimnae]TXF83268.1 hypothetical protein FTX54_12860 [Alkalicoccus halolimnae]